MVCKTSVPRTAILVSLLAASYFLTVHAIGEPSTTWLAAMCYMTVHLASDRLIPHWK
jgi:hypothetical protein